MITELRRADWGPAAVHFGEVEVMRQVTSFTRRHPETGQPLGEYPLDLPPRALRTRAVWWTISGGQRAALMRRGVDLPGAAHAAEHASIGLLPLFAACDRWDIGGVSADLHPATGRLTVFVYDGHEGGAGFAERGFAAARDWLAATRQAIADCECDDGLPVLRPVTQVRQRQRAAEQGRCAAAAGPPAGTAARERSGRKRQEMRRPPPGGRAGVAVRPRIPGPSSRKA